MAEESQLSCWPPVRVPPPKAAAISSEGGEEGQGEEISKAFWPYIQGSRPLPYFSKSRCSPATSFSLLEPQPCCVPSPARRAASGPLEPPPQEAARCLFHFYFLHRHLDTKEGKALLFSLDQRAKYSLWPSRSAQGFLLKPRGLGRGVRAQCSCLAPGSQTSHFLPRLPSVLTSPTPQTLKSNKGHWKR